MSGVRDFRDGARSNRSVFGTYAFSVTPLDLRASPPRPPVDALDGLVFLPRTIDKARALIPGGSLGAYALHGLSEMMLSTIRVAPARFCDAVRGAGSDAEVAAWLRERADTTAYGRWNEWLLSRRIDDAGHRARVTVLYPAAADPSLVRIVDVLAADDEEGFAHLRRRRVAS